MREHRSILGLVVYYWGWQEQNRLLAEWLQPFAKGLKTEGRLPWLWFDRFDARGPHLFGLFDIPSPDQPAVRRRLSDQLRRYLQKKPSEILLDTEELEEHHRGCAGKSLCIIDQESGLAENNTFRIFDHDLDRYPFSIARAASHGVGPAGDELWDGVGALTSWSLGVLFERGGKRAHGAALRLLAAVDRELGPDPAHAAAFWRYHSATFLHFLRDEKFDDAETTLRDLPRLIGEKNLRNLGGFWPELRKREDPFPELSQLVRLAQERVDVERRPPFALLREVLHWALKQIGLPVQLHPPLLLLAWYANLKWLVLDETTMGDR